MLTNDQVEILNESGKEIILITDNLYSKLGNNVITYNDVYEEYSNSYNYSVDFFDNVKGVKGAETFCQN